MFATTNSPMGMTMGITVNLTPTPAGPVPIPYPSIGHLMMFDPGSLHSSVLIQGFMATKMGSKTIMTLGDTPGVNGGVVSGKFGGPASILTGSTCVFMGGVPAGTMLSLYGSNGEPVMNTVANQISPSCTNVMIMR
jgi:hypothetical protein